MLACVLGLGAEELSPGAHNCETAPQLTWDVYIPKAYAERPQEKFPAL